MASLTMAQAALLTQDQLIQGVAKHILTVDLFANTLPFVATNAKSLVINRELTESGSAFVDINGSTNATGATVTQDVYPLGRIVGDVEVDDFEQVAMSSINDQMGLQTELKSKAVGRKWKDAIITGTGTFPQFSGISNLVDASQIVEASSTTSDGSLTLALLDQLLDQVTAKDGEVDFLLMNATMRRKFRALVRAQGFSNEEVELGFLDPITGDRGTQKVHAYDGIPIFRNDFIGTETVNGGSGKHRIYAGVYGEGEGLVGLSPSDTDPGIRISVPFLSETKDATLRRVKMYTGLGRYSKRALAKLSNLTAA